MMKKNGFTLAEVLITLTIIGVVAMMTLPALMTNVQEQQARTGLKKGINTLTEAAQMSEAVSGFNYGSLRKDLERIDENSPETQTMTGLLMSRVAVDMGKSKLGLDQGTGYPLAAKAMLEPSMSGSAAASTYRGNPCVAFLRDGSCLIYNPEDTASTDENSRPLEDGLPLGFTVLYDINGTKGPNALSNCNGATNPDNDQSYSYPINADQLNRRIGTEACIERNRSNRKIYDQFLLQVRRNVVQPASPAAVWAATE